MIKKNDILNDAIKSETSGKKVKFEQNQSYTNLGNNNNPKDLLKETINNKD